MRQFPTPGALEEALADAYREDGIPVIEHDGRLFARFVMEAESGEVSVCEIDIGKLADRLRGKLP